MTINATRLPQAITAKTMSSPLGLEVTILNIGATIQSIRVPVNDKYVNVVLGYPTLSEYWCDTMYMGATVGRYANRIRGAQFLLGGIRYELEANELETGNCLHGGPAGLHKRFWDLHVDECGAIVCRYTSPDGEGGFPGNLQVIVKYQINDGFSLVVDYWARSDSDTVLSLANHAYFNLEPGCGTIDSHELCLLANRYTPVDTSGVPSGEIVPVRDSDFDLRRPTPLRSHDGSVLRYDHNFLLSKKAEELCEAAHLLSRKSGMRMRLYTTQVGLQLYTGDQLNGVFKARQGLCLEAQSFPDAPNQAAFPSAQLSAGDAYRQRTIYEFVPPTD